MQVFAIFGVNHPEHVVKKLNEHYGGSYYAADGNTFLKSSTTSRRVIPLW